MAIKFVRVRRVTDHTITAELAEQSLPVWEGVWEPIPTAEQQTATPQQADNAPAEQPEPKTKTRRASAAKEKE